MLTAMNFTTLLVNIDSMTSKSNAGGCSKICVAWKTEQAVHYFVHSDEVTTDPSTDYGKEPQSREGCLISKVAQPLYKIDCKDRFR